MARVLQLRRGTTAEINAITGAEGELFVDLDKNAIVVMDGTTQGGQTLQSELVSGTNIKTVNGVSILGAGDVDLSTNLTLNGTNLEYTDIDGNVDTIDLSGFLDDTTNTIVSGTLNGNTITFTREDATTFDVDVTALYDDTNLVTSVNGDTGAITVQETLVSGTNIKTINNESLLGSGNIDITSAEWGNITGTLSSQTDLQNALNAKQDDLVSGTNIKTVNGQTLLGSGDLEIGGGVEVSDTAPSSPSEGDLWWDSTTGTLKVYYDDGDSQQWVDASPTLSSDFTEDVNEPPFDFDTASFGDAACGGIYMGQITAAGQCYALIVAPNATGCAIAINWKNTQTSTAGTDSDVDGFANTYGPLDNADHPAGNWCATRTINGFSDWYLPAIDELEVFYNNGATGGDESVIGSGEAFASSLYWSSTESDASIVYALFFDIGIRYFIPKTYSNSIRAVRREPI